MLSRWCAACTSPSPSLATYEDARRYAERHRLEAERLNDMELRPSASKAEPIDDVAVRRISVPFLKSEKCARASNSSWTRCAHARASACAGRRPEPIGVGSAAGPRSLAPLVGVDVRRPLQKQRGGTPSIQRHGIARRAGRALHLQRRPHEQELVGLVGDQLRQVHVLQVPDAALGLQLDVALEGLRGLAASSPCQRLRRPRCRRRSG